MPKEKMRQNAERSGVIGNIVTGLVAMSIISLVYNQYIFSGFLYLDDNIYLSRSILGSPLYPSQGIGGYWMIGLVGKLGSLAAIKFASLLFVGAAAAMIAAILHWIGVGRAVASAAALFVVTFPIAISQAFFVTGAHAVMGSAWMLAALYVFLRFHGEPIGRYVIGMMGVFALAVTALLFSPTMILMPVLPVAWLALAYALGRLSARRLICTSVACVLTGVPVGFVTMRAHHYGSLVGWVDMSPGTVFLTLFNSIKAILLGLDLIGPAVAAFYVLLLGILLGIIVADFLKRRTITVTSATGTRSNPRDAVMFFGFCSLTAGAAFGPASINVSFQERYAFAPFLFAVLGLIGLSLTCFRHRPRALDMALVSIFVMLTGLNIVQRYAELNRDFGRQLRTEALVSDLIVRQQATWPQDAQVLLMLGGKLVLPTGGYNHWSTWYVRGHAKRKDLIAIVGREESVRGSPFISKYADHSSEFWKVVNGKSSRQGMVGLERGRALFAYRLTDGDDAFRPVTVAFRDDRGLFFVSPGAVPNSTTRMTPEAASCVDDAGEIYSWPVSLDGRQPLDGSDRTLPAGKTFSFEGQSDSAMSLALNDGECVDIRMRLKSNSAMPARRGYDEAYPPMPLVGPALGVYQDTRGFTFLAEDAQGVTFGGTQTFADLRIVGREGRNYNIIADGMVHRTDLTRLSGSWRFGRGFLKRFWNGRIMGFAVTVDGVDKTAERLRAQTPP